MDPTHARTAQEQEQEVVVEKDRTAASDASSFSSASTHISTLSNAPRCSYRCYNQYDEIDTCQCISFNSTGDKIYACSQNLVRIFDVNRPGRECTGLRTVRSKRDPYSMFKGLISTVEFSPDPSMHVYSCGTFSNSLAVFVEGTPESVLMLLDVPVGNGITCQRWSPDGNNLWLGGRNGSDIICYDLRSTRKELGRVTRSLSTQQRLSFDLDPWGKFLATGSQDGEVLIYETCDFTLHSRMTEEGEVAVVGGGALSDTSASTGVSVGRGRGSMDCTNSVQFHPFSALLCVSSGQRHFHAGAGVGIGAGVSGDESGDCSDDDDTRSDCGSSWQTAAVASRKRKLGNSNSKSNSASKSGPSGLQGRGTPGSSTPVSVSSLRLARIGCERLPNPFGGDD
jgi:WD40 repeat protein